SFLSCVSDDVAAEFFEEGVRGSEDDPDLANEDEEPMDMVVEVCTHAAVQVLSGVDHATAAGRRPPGGLECSPGSAGVAGVVEAGGVHRRQLHAFGIDMGIGSTVQHALLR